MPIVSQAIFLIVRRNARRGLRDETISFASEADASKRKEEHGGLEFAGRHMLTGFCGG
jgi:hypothetical protein